MQTGLVGLGQIFDGNDRLHGVPEKLSPCAGDASGSGERRRADATPRDTTANASKGYQQTMYFRPKRVFTRRTMEMAGTESAINPSPQPGTALISAIAVGVCVIESDYRRCFFPFGTLRRLSHFN